MEVMKIFTLHLDTLDRHGNFTKHRISIFEKATHIVCRYMKYLMYIIYKKKLLLKMNSILEDRSNPVTHKTMFLLNFGLTVHR